MGYTLRAIDTSSSGDCRSFERPSRREELQRSAEPAVAVAPRRWALYRGSPSDLSTAFFQKNDRATTLLITRKKR
jgi:hypothetical protein